MAENIDFNVKKTILHCVQQIIILAFAIKGSIMNIEELDDYCMTKKGVTVSTPFDEVTLVYKVMDKMFALSNINNFKSINLKCDPEYALELRAEHVEIQPGYHMSKKHWNTVLLNELLDDAKVYELIDHSYEMVVSGLAKKLQKELGEMD